MGAAGSVTIAGRRYRLQGPSWRDPRLHLSAVILSLQVIGQIWFDFEVSISQFLVCILTCVVIEMAMTAWRDAAIVWPGGALQTGNSLAFILHVNGTQHGDWWTLRGWYILAAACALGILAKYALRIDGRPMFNPSNIGIVVALLILGTGLVNPLDYWWAPWGGPLIAAYAVIVVGALTVVRRVHMLPMALTFLATFAVGNALLTGSGHCMTTRWSVTPVCGGQFWSNVALSPETLVFTFFMVTDPRSTPSTARGRLWFGLGIGVIATLLVAPAQTEFWAKTGLLVALAVACVIRYAVRRWSTQLRSLLTPRPVLAAVATVAVVGGILVAGLPARPSAFATTPTAAGRPSVAVGPLPRVTMGDGVDRIAGSLSPAAADYLGRQVAEAIAIEDQCLRTGDATLLDTALAGKELAAARAEVDRGTPAPAMPSFDSMTAVVVRDPHNHQAIPQLGIRATGTLAGRSFDSVYVLIRSGDDYLLSERRTPAEAGLDL
jgi:Na+-translocating ferredoxin:NAD+ oxidoreductase RnfD subunit